MDGDFIHGLEVGKVFFVDNGCLKLLRLAIDGAGLAGGQHVGDVQLHVGPYLIEIGILPFLRFSKSN